MFKRLCLMFCLLLPISVVAGSGVEPLESIRAAALATLGQGVDAELTLDPAVRMPACGAPLQAQRAASGTIEVSCPDGWRLYVPVKVRHHQAVLVLTRSAAAGETVSADMLERQTREGGRLVGAMPQDPDQVVGQVLRRGLAAGSVLAASDLVSPRLVRRGDQVTLVSRRGGLEVRVAGRALGDAGANDRVSVENLSSRRTVQGRVDANGDVLVIR